MISMLQFTTILMHIISKNLLYNKVKNKHEYLQKRNREMHTTIRPRKGVLTPLVSLTHP